MRSAVTRALNKGKMLGILYLLCIRPNLLRQKTCKIRNRNAGGDFRLRFLCGVQHVLLSLDQSPFKTFLRSVNIEALAILPGGVKQKPPDMRGDIRILNFDMTRLDRKPVPRLLRERLVDGTGSET